MKDFKNIAVLLATFNGERYLESQIDSILAQIGVNIHLFVRDDGSTDRTMAILNSYKERFPSQVSLVEKKGSKSGHLANFSSLCDFALKTEYQYFSFADQDDIWEKDKLDVSLSNLISVEQLSDSLKPVLVHSDLQVVDEEAVEIAPSFIDYQGLPCPTKHNFPQLLHQNVVTGCTILFNRALLSLALPIPTNAVIHDFWFAQCAKYMGELLFVNRPLVRYRQHGINAVGAVSLKEQKSVFKKYFYYTLVRFPYHMRKAVHQAYFLEKRAIERNIAVSAESHQYIAEFGGLLNINGFNRIRQISIFFKGERSIAQKLYLRMVFWLLPYIKFKS